MVSLVPKWARPAAILGMKIGLLQIKCICMTEKERQEILVFLKAEIETLEAELARIAAMKD